VPHGGVRHASAGLVDGRLDRRTHSRLDGADRAAEELYSDQVRQKLNRPSTTQMPVSIPTLGSKQRASCAAVPLLTALMARPRSPRAQATPSAGRPIRSRSLLRGGCAPGARAPNALIRESRSVRIRNSSNRPSSVKMHTWVATFVHVDANPLHGWPPLAALTALSVGLPCHHVVEARPLHPHLPAAGAWRSRQTSLTNLSRLRKK